jgi:hypothetical protein
MPERLRSHVAGRGERRAMKQKFRIPLKTEVKNGKELFAELNERQRGTAGSPASQARRP